MEFASSPFYSGLLDTALAVVALLALTFAVAVNRHRHSIIDTVWGLGFIVIAAVSFWHSSGHGCLARRILILALVAVWGLRLATHVARRAIGKGEDPRYVAMLEKGGASPNRRALVVVYLPQGVAMWWVSLPVQIAMYGGRPLRPLDALGGLIALVGLSFEAIGDLQLTRFLADPAHRGEVMDHGLWRYTRHPNYFGDALFWWGIFVIAAAHLPGVFTILSPVAMTVLLTRGTGKALLERTVVDRRPGYADYVSRTSGFVPLPPKRRRDA